MSHCLVIKVLCFLSLRQLIYFITSFFVCQELFSSFFKLFRCSFKQFALSLTACLLYHTQKGLSTSFLTFFKVFQVVSSKESFLCDSQINLPLSSASVNCFFHNLSVQSVNNNLEQQAQVIFANRFLSLATLFTIDSPLNFT